MFDKEKAKILTVLKDPLLEKQGVIVLVKREDMVYPVAGGNKWRKLKYNLKKAKEKNKTALVTFGGAYSNHIAAIAFAGMESEFKTIGIIRGEKTKPLNITLKRAEECGMELIFVTRKVYRDKELAVEVAFKGRDRTNFHIIPEGGSNYAGFKGCCEIAPEIKSDFDYICCPCGTGTTLAGIAALLKGHQQAIGFSVMKNNLKINETVNNFLEKYFHKNRNLNSYSYQGEIRNRDLQYKVFHEYHFGGYAKFTPELDEFVKRFNEINTIEIEPVYTGKMFFGIYDLIKKGVFKKGDMVVSVHTGGLQYLK